MTITLIAAISNNNVIGVDGRIPWHLPEDMKRFSKLTKKHPVIMGRATYESIPEKYRPLPKRQNIVVTRQQDYRADGAYVVNSIDDALLLANQFPTDDGRIYVAGGQDLYQATIDLADILEITHVKREVDGDRFFPSINPEMWKQFRIEQHDDFTFVTYHVR